MLPAPWLLALALVVGLLVLIPARRLQLGGVSARAAGAYVVVLWVLAMAVAIRPVATRFLVPILLVAYLAPFIAGPDQVRRWLRRPPAGGAGGAARDGVERPPMKDVTPPDQRGSA
jgi:hypothetical protein